MKDKLFVIIGLGATGFSVARFLASKHLAFALIDTRVSPEGLDQFKQLFPMVKVSLGVFDDVLLNQAETVILSPGVSLAEPRLQKLLRNGIPVYGDIELFARHVDAPVIAITGTNAKSTVTSLVGLMARGAGLNVKVGGNIGVPALDLLSDTAPDLYVLELSSYQLETLESLKPIVSCILNISPDHMDRYDSFTDYINVKHRIYPHSDRVVYNADDGRTKPRTLAKTFRFTLKTPESHEFGLTKVESSLYLSFGQNLLVDVAELPVTGKHYYANALAALALGYAYGLSFDSMIKVLKDFTGLKHRCEFVREIEGVKWYNDSKGTNVGATVAAIIGIGEVIEGKIILIAGGVGKNADFSDLLSPVLRFVRKTILIGEAAQELSELLPNTMIAESLDEAISISRNEAKPGDSVLLSPACASFDMFKNFEHRGDVFTALVQGLA